MLGGYPEETYLSATALVSSYLLSGDEALTGAAEAWEKAYIDLLKKASNSDELKGVRLFAFVFVFVFTSVVVISSFH